jgi:hypothetical protein
MKQEKNFTRKNDILEIVLIVFAWIIAFAILYYVLFKLSFYQ